MEHAFTLSPALSLSLSFPLRLSLGRADLRLCVAGQVYGRFKFLDSDPTFRAPLSSNANSDDCTNTAA